MDFPEKDRYNGEKGGEAMYYAEYNCPVGKLLLVSDGEALTGLYMNRELPERTEELPVFFQVRRWLDAYFRGEEREIDFPMKAEGTPFQMLVWQLLLAIPFGQTRTYGELAKEAAARMGKEKMSAQAVGGAVSRNPISIVIPCHRVIGVDGRLTGYAGGLENKKWLLFHEGGKENADK